MDVEGLYKLARITCIRANLHRNSPNREFEFEDWVQEAVLGVITNLHKFDPDRGSQRNFYITYMRQRLSFLREFYGRKKRTPPVSVLSIDRMSSDIATDKRIPA